MSAQGALPPAPRSADPLPLALQETYKLPHRLIEKKRRDRINECIAQLKDLLPEHLKLTVGWSGLPGPAAAGGAGRSRLLRAKAPATEVPPRPGLFLPLQRGFEWVFPPPPAFPSPVYPLPRSGRTPGAGCKHNPDCPGIGALEGLREVPAGLL